MVFFINWVFSRYVYLSSCQKFGNCKCQNVELNVEKNMGYRVNKPPEKLIQLDEYCNFIGQPLV